MHRVAGEAFVSQPGMKSFNGVGQCAGIQPTQNSQLFGG